VIENTLILWGLALLAAALVLVIAEVFVPSGGLIGMTAAVLAIAGVVVFWRVSWVWGGASLAVVMILAPIAFNFALRVMPHTPMGRRLILADEIDPERQAVDDQRRAAQEQALIGATGVALTDLRPVGTVEIEGTRLEVLAEGGMIRAGSRVRVTASSGNQVKVRAIV